MQDFPIDVTRIFQNQVDSISEEKEITKLFNTNNSVRKAFLTWAHQHSSLTAQNLRLYKAYNIAFNAEQENRDDPLEKIASRIVLFANWMAIATDKDRKLEIVLQKDLKNLTPEDRNEIFTSTKKIAGLCSTGVISPELLFQLLSIKDSQGSNLLFNSEIFKSIIPFLQTLMPEQRDQVLSTRNNHGLTPLFYPEIFKTVVPSLQTLSPELVLQVLSIKNSNGLTPLHSPEVFTAAIPLFQTINPQLLPELLSIKDDAGWMPLDYLSVFRAAIPLLQTFTSDLLVQVLSEWDRNGLTPLHGPKIFTAAISFFQTLSPELLLQVLSVKDSNGLTPLHYPEVFAAAIPLFQSFNTEQLLPLLSIRNNEGWIPLDYPSVFRAAIPLFQTFTSDFLIQVLSERDRNGLTPLHGPKIFTTAIPFLQTLSSELILKVLSVKDSNELTPLHSPEVFTVAIPLLQTLSPELLLQVLSIKDNKGLTPLHYPEVFTAVTPWFQSMTPELLLQLLSIRNNEGWIPLDYTSVFKAAIPLLRTFTPDLLVQVLSTKDKNGLPSLHGPNIFTTAIPLLQALEPELLLKVLSIKDSNGLTPLNSPEVFTVSIPFLQTLTPQVLLQILSIRNGGGWIPFDYPSVFRSAIPLFQTFTSDQLIKVLSAKDKNGLSPLHGSSIFKTAISYLQTLSPELLLQVLSVKDSNGLTPLHSSDIFTAAIPLLETFVPDQLVLVLSIRDSKGSIPLHKPEIFEEAIPLLQRLPEDLLYSLLIIENNTAEIPLQNNAIFEIAISLLDLVPRFFNNLDKAIPFLNITFVRNIIFPTLKTLSSQELQALPEDIRLFVDICRDCPTDRFEFINQEFSRLVQPYFKLMGKNNPIKIAELSQVMHLMVEGSFDEAYSVIGISFNTNPNKISFYDWIIPRRPELLLYALNKYEEFPRFEYMTSQGTTQAGIDAGGLRNQAVSDLALNLLDNNATRLAKLEPNGITGSIPVWRVASKKKSVSQVAFSTESGLTITDQLRLYNALGSLLAKCFLVPSVVTGRVLSDQYISLIQKLYQAEHEEVQSYFEVYGTPRDKAMIELLYSSEEFNNDKILKYYFLKSCTPVDTQILPGVIEFPQMVETGCALLINAYANPETDLRTAISQLCRQNLNELIPSNEMPKVVSSEALSDIIFHGNPDFASVIGYTLSLAALNQLDEEKPFKQQLNILMTWIVGHIPQITKEDLKKEFIAEFIKYGGENKLQPVRSIVKGIRSVLRGKKEEQAFLTLSSADVSEQIQGQSFNREEIAQRIVADPEASESVITQTNWLRECVLDETGYDETWIKKMLVAATGQPAVTSSTIVKIEGSSKPLITSATCFKKIYVPESSLTKDRFLELLNYLVETKEFGLT